MAWVPVLSVFRAPCFRSFRAYFDGQPLVSPAPSASHLAAGMA